VPPDGPWRHPRGLTDNGDVDSALVATAVQAFDLGEGDVVVTPGHRGAAGQVWRLAVGPLTYALKHAFSGHPPPGALVAAQMGMARRATLTGVRTPASHPGRDGGYVVPLPGGGWLRLFEWLDLERADLSAEADALGGLLARLHRVGGPMEREPDGSPPDGWYDRPPAPESWAPLVAAAAEAEVAWSTRLSGAVRTMPALYALLVPADPARMRCCHRDLHPANVLAGRTGELVVVDWDDLGPADPVRELASALVACYHDGDPDLGSMRRAYRAYVEAGGPARLERTTDFTMRISTALNFLHRQVRVALDPGSEPGERAWAELEIDESLRILPTPELLTNVLDACRS
jgi:Ser/Thr protein kinase RdoA (MazF antagonist)